MILKLYILWDILIPITILSIVISIIPFIIHIRLRNWPATFMTILFAIYGILTTTNALINRTIPINYILNFTHTYWFCWIYDIGLSTIKVGCTGCYLRLLNRLLVLLQKMAAQQQRHTYHPDDPNQHTENVIIATIRRIISVVSPLRYSVTVSTRRRRQPWKIKLLQAKNTLELLYQDHHLLLWDIVFIWILPIIYMALSTSVDTHYAESEYFDTSIRYIYYSPSMGCLNRKTYGFTASTIYYIYPLLLMCVGCVYTVLIAIKMKQLKLYFRAKSSDHRLKRLPFYRLFIFCCLYNLLYVLHLPFIVPNYLTVVLHQRIPISERAMYLSKNGLIFQNDKTFEILVIFMYPLLSVFWSIFFGTTQEAYILYRSMWHWLKNRSRTWRGKQRTMDDEGHNDDGDQQQLQQEIAEQEPLLPPPEIHLAPATTVSSYTSTLIAASLSRSTASSSSKTSTLPPIDHDTLPPYITSTPEPRPLSSLSASSLDGDYKPSLRSTDRRTFSSIPCFPERATVYHSAYSTIDISPPSAAESSVTLINHCNY